MNHLSNYYKQKKVLITGHTGFKGSWLSFWLSMMGANICGYALEPSTEPNLFNLLELNTKINNNIGDVRDFNRLENVIKDFKPEIIFHMAAQPLVRESYKNPAYTYETNVMGTVNILEIARKTESVKSIINITTDKCYHNNEWIYGYRENDELGGYDPYSSSKACAELVSESYRNSFFNPTEYGKTHKISLSTVRAGNVIGGGDWAKDRLVPDCIKAIVNNEEIIIRSPKATRPWQHVLEPLSGYLWLGVLMGQDGKKFAQAWNFGPEDKDIWEVESVVNGLIKNFGKGSYKVENKKQPHEASLLKLDISKVKFYLDWKPVYHVNESIQETANWYKAYYSGEKDLIELTKNQINSYVDQARETKTQWSLS